jgi:hypothetical protein
VRRTLSKSLRQGNQIDSVPFLEQFLAEPMLLRVVISTQADGVLIGWLEADPTITFGTHMRAFNRSVVTARH